MRQVTTCMAKKKGGCGVCQWPFSQASEGGTRLPLTAGCPSAGVRCIVTLECTEARGEGGTPSRYTTQKV